VTRVKFGGADGTPLTINGPPISACAALACVLVAPLERLPHSNRAMEQASLAQVNLKSKH
jgi:hypothetical protein